MSIDNQGSDAAVDSGSLSKGQNCNGQKELWELSGSQAKTAYALRINCETMAREAGIGRIGFLTLTVGERNSAGKWEHVLEMDEASRRFHSLAAKILPLLFVRYIAVPERHKNRGIHFHLLGELRAEFGNIRNGFDFASFTAARDARDGGTVCAEAERLYALAAAPALRDAWAMLRERLPGFGFGRAELTPVEKEGEQIASYIAKYIEKNISNRDAGDVGRRLVRYSGWSKSQLKAADFSWATEGACEWRRNGTHSINPAASAIAKVTEKCSSSPSP